MHYKVLTKDDLSDKVLNNCADWWFERFMGPQIKDNGSVGHMPSMLSGFLSAKIAEKYPITEAHREPFREGLAKAIRGRLDKYPNTASVMVSCDYHPDWVLRDAMALANIDESRAPWKTNMKIGNLYQGSGVSIGAGYGADWVFAWNLEGEVPTVRKVYKYTAVYPAWERRDGRKFEHVEHDSLLFLAYDEDVGVHFVKECEKEPGMFNGIPDSYNRLEESYTERLINGEWIR